MTGGIETAAWRVMGRSVCGASHRRRGRPNQDAIEWSCTPGGVAIAVADGHGASACFRSADGAAFAVRAANQLLAEFVERPRDIPAAEWIPEELVTRWRELVTAHTAAHPIASNGAGPSDPWLPYGTTILAVLATDTHLVYLQLGDGDILIVSKTGDVVRPWPKDPRLLGVETTSLCRAEAAADTRVFVQPIGDSAPALIILSTDGYCNSFRDDEGFVAIGRDLLQMIREDGLDKVEGKLEHWLNEATEFGSGDDITLGLLCRSAAMGGARDGG